MERFLESMIATKENVAHADVKIKYGYDLIRNEFVKFLLFTMFFLLIDKFLIYLFVLALFIPIRMYSGGIHMKTNITCGLFSFVFLVLAICVLPKIVLPLKYSFMLLAAAFIILAIFSPFSSPKKPVPTKAKYYKFKIISIVWSFISICIICYCFYRGFLSYAYPAQWIIVLQAIQLIIAHILRKEKNAT